jgi:hypothetical protein
MSRFRAGFIFSVDHVLQHLLVEREIGHQLLEPLVHLLELLQPHHLRGHQPAILLAPIVVGRLADAGLTAHLLDPRALRRLPAG